MTEVGAVDPKIGSNPGKDTWAVVTATMILVFLVLKYIARGIGYIATPLVILVRFITNRYADQINRFVSWIKRQLWHRRQGNAGKATA